MTDELSTDAKDFLSLATSGSDVSPNDGDRKRVRKGVGVALASGAAGLAASSASRRLHHLRLPCCRPSQNLKRSTLGKTWTASSLSLTPTARTSQLTSKPTSRWRRRQGQLGRTRGGSSRRRSHPKRASWRSLSPRCRSAMNWGCSERHSAHTSKGTSERRCASSTRTRTAFLKAGWRRNETGLASLCSATPRAWKRRLARKRGFSAIIQPHPSPTGFEAGVTEPYNFLVTDRSPRGH